jgi:6-phosphogluconolactonase
VTGDVRLVEDVPASFADLFVGELDAFLATSPGRNWRVALSGGSTARRCYEELARRDGVGWAEVEIFWGDERCVAPDDPDSNQLLAHEVLLDHVGPLAAVHPMIAGELDASGPGGWQVAADAYDALLQRGGPLDLIHLGFGPDGHTASLFPDSAALSAPSDRLVVTSVDPRGVNPFTRLTVTYAAIDAAACSVFTVSGREKHDAYSRLLAGEDLPAARVTGDRVIWLVDPAAAEG